MTNSTTRILYGIIATLLSSAAATADTQPGYLTDTTGTVVRSGYNSCWHTGYWTSDMAIEACDPSLVKQQEMGMGSGQETEPAAEKMVEPATEPVAAPVDEQETEQAAEPVPEPMAEATEGVPLPVPVTTPQRVVQKKVSFSAETLLGFNKTTLRPEGKRTLDGLVQELQGMDYDSIQVIGHSDRIGKPKYNQKLSEQRAQSVRNYLISKNVPANNIVTEGKGETQPVTQADDCTGPRSKKLIACLQPDRRVEIEVSGTKQLAQQ